MEQESQQQTQQTQQQQQQQQGAERDVELGEAGPSFKPLEGPTHPLQVCSPARVGSCISWPMLRTHARALARTPTCTSVSLLMCMFVGADGTEEDV